MALTYTAIASTDKDAESPLTVQTVGRMIDNPIASHKYLRRGADSGGVTSSTVLVDDGTLQFSVEANQAYAFKMVLFVDCDMGGVRTAIDVPAACTISVCHICIENASTAAVDAAGAVIVGAYHTETDDDPAIFGNVGWNVDMPMILIEGLAINGANAGTLKLRYAQGVSNGGDTTIIKDRSYLTYHRVDPLS